MVVGPNTLFHGDYRADNLLFNENNEPVAIDFQLLTTGTGAYDIAYFVTQSLTPEVASKHERDLFDQWVTALITHGAPAGLVDRDALWLH
jgi:aminoglycoside phosphotransferase (APT) family kinase protein